MKPLHLILIIVLSTLTSGIVAHLTIGNNASSVTQPAQETAYDRIMRTNVIRCGYSSWKPFLYVNPNTREKAGLFYDLTEEIAKRYNLKVEWTEEVGLGEVVTALNSHRFDMACSAYWANTNRGKQVYFSNPVFFSKGFVWTRGDDTRQFTSYEQLNDPAYTFVYIDGGAVAKAIHLRFPKANKQSLPEMAPISDSYEAVATGKADFLEENKASINDYLQTKPNALKLAVSNPPLILNPVVMMTAGGEDRLKQMVDNGLREIELDGTLDRILTKYKANDLFERTAY